MELAAVDFGSAPRHRRCPAKRPYPSQSESILGIVLTVVAAWQDRWLSGAITSSLSAASAWLAVLCYRLAARNF
jgi:hypothetical protein